MFRKSLGLAACAVWAAFWLSGCGGKSVSVTVTATPSTVDGTNTATLTATVANDGNPGGVTWSVSGGGALSNQTTTTATYTAPAPPDSALTVTVTATSVADKNKTGTATITVPKKPAITTTATELASIVGTAYSVQLAGNGGITPYTWTLSSGALPPCLTMTPGGLISGSVVASCAGAYTPTFTMTDSGSPNKLTATQEIDITIAAAPAITFSGLMPATGTYQVIYGGSAAAFGGAGTLTYTLASGALPGGLSLDATTGAVTGSPTAVGTFNFTIRAADAFGDAATQAYQIVVSYPQLSITTAAALPAGYANGSYSQTLAATGGSGTGYVWTVTPGSTLPAGVPRTVRGQVVFSPPPTGLTLSSDGLLSGVPSAANQYSFSITVTDSAQNTVSKTFTLTINAGITISTGATLPVGYVNGHYSQNLAATGGSGTGWVWTVTSGSALPAGLNLSTAGVLSGTPTAQATSTFNITVTDSANNTANQTFSLTVDPGVSITSSATLPKGYQGTAYPMTMLSASGGTGSGFTWGWAAAGGSTLPAGLSLSAGGEISGIPTGSGTFNIVVTVTDSAHNTATQNATLVVEATLSISSPATLPSGTINVAYMQTLTATGGSGTYSTWAVTAGGGTLTPLSLSLSAAGVLSGTPTVTGTATFTVRVTDSESHTATADLSVTVYNALTVTTTTLPAAYSGTAYSQTLVAGGGSGSGYTWATTGASNLGTFNLSLSSAGVISGTPTSSGTVNFTAQVTDSGSHTATQALSITVYNALTLPTPSASVPGPGTTGVAYTGSLATSGGSGGYSWTITGMPQDGLSTTPAGNLLNISGTPTAAQTVTFTAKVTDTTTNVSVGPNTYNIVVSNPAPLVLPATNPASLPSATVNQAYGGSITATGGISPYTWRVNGTAVPSNGTPLALANGLSATNDGGLTLSIGGTPTTTTTVTLSNVTITDNASTSTGPYTYTVAVNAAGQQVSGQIQVINVCAGSITVPQYSVHIANKSGTPAYTADVTSDNNGQYSFASIPAGSYTMTPSVAGANPPSALFTPATQDVTVTNSTVTASMFTVSLGYTMSGNVNYGGSSTGRIYVALTNNNCSGSPQPGTSISAIGAYTIRGVPPGNYTMMAWMDILGVGSPNVVDPKANIQVSNSSLTGNNLTLTDPTPTLPTSGPDINLVMPSDLGVVISYGAISMSINNANVERADSYEVQWSTSSTFTTVSGSITEPAVGADSAGVWILNNSTSGISGTFSNGTQYYFRARGKLGTNNTPWTVYIDSSSNPKAVTIGQITGFNTITGTITIPVGVAVSGPLYAGFFSQQSGIFAKRIASPVVGANAFSVSVPTGNDYFYFGILDQNNDGVIDVGDVTNVNDNTTHSVNITGSANVGDLALSSAGGFAVVRTQYWSQTSSGGTYTGYGMNFQLNQGTKLPVLVTLTSGGSVVTPVDLSNWGTSGGTVQYAYRPSLETNSPNLGATYHFEVTYSDGTGEILDGTVTGVLGPSQLASNLSPNITSTGLQPTFSWSYPASASTYYYQFQLFDANYNEIWRIPGSGGNSLGFTSSVIPSGSITWNVDPTNSNNHARVNALTSGLGYNWYIETRDSNGNSAQKQTYFITP